MRDAKELEFMAKNSHQNLDENSANDDENIAKNG